MNEKKAKAIITAFEDIHNPTPAQEDEYVSASLYLIETKQDSSVMSYLGGFYYEKGKYDLAEKYYLMADEHGDTYAADGLGYIYYYGRNGVKDYAKALKYYLKASHNGNLEAKMKVADMFHLGQGVSQDDRQYETMLLEIYEEIKDTNRLFDPFPEVVHRLAQLYIPQGNGLKMLPDLKRAKGYITERISYSSFWGNYVVCRKVIECLYQLVEFNPESFDFYDLFYYFETENQAILHLVGDKDYHLSSFSEDGRMKVSLDDTVYSSLTDFLQHAPFAVPTSKMRYGEDYWIEALEA